MAKFFGKVRLFISETISELQKSVWPTKAELKDSTLVVLFATLLVGAYIALCDFSFFNIIDFLTGLVSPSA